MRLADTRLARLPSWLRFNATEITILSFLVVMFGLFTWACIWTLQEEGRLDRQQGLCATAGGIFDRDTKVCTDPRRNTPIPLPEQGTGS